MILESLQVWQISSMRNMTAKFTYNNTKSIAITFGDLKRVENTQWKALKVLIRAAFWLDDKERENQVCLPMLQLGLMKMNGSLFQYQEVKNGLLMKEKKIQNHSIVWLNDIKMDCTYKLTRHWNFYKILHTQMNRHFLKCQ